MNAPKRKFSIAIEAGGDTLDDAVGEARRMVDLAADGSRSCVSGGYSTGSVLTVTEREGITHDDFVKELDAYLETE